MEKFTFGNNEIKKEENVKPFLERFRKGGIWVKGALAGLMLGFSMESDASTEKGADGKNMIEKVILDFSLSDAFASGSPRMRESDKDQLIKEIQQSFLEMSVEDRKEIINNPYIAGEIQITSDSRKLMNPVGNISTNEQLTQARAYEAESVWREAVEELDFPDMDESLDEEFQEKILSKNVNIKTRIYSKEDIISIHPEMANKTDAEIYNFARSASLKLVVETPIDSYNNIREDLYNFDNTYYLVDKSGSMAIKLNKVISYLKDVHTDGKLFVDSFGEHADGGMDQMYSFEDVEGYVGKIYNGPRLNINEKAMSSVLEALKEMKPSKEDESNLLRAFTDEALQDVSLSAIDEIEKLSMDKEISVKVSLYDIQAGMFREIDINQIKNHLVDNFEDATPNDVFEFRINNGKIEIERTVSSMDTMIASK